MRLRLCRGRKDKQSYVMAVSTSDNNVLYQSFKSRENIQSDPGRLNPGACQQLKVFGNPPIESNPPWFMSSGSTKRMASLVMK